MKKVYFLAPAIALAVFYYFYSTAKTHYDAEAVAKVQQEKQDNIDRLKQEAKDREAAIKEALALNATRKAEKAAKAAAELARKETRQAATDSLDLANSERKRLKERLSSLERDIQGVEGDIGKLESEHKRLTDEATFLRSFVSVAQNNEKAFAAVIQDIQKAEKAHAAALIAAANADKK